MTKNAPESRRSKQASRLMAWLVFIGLAPMLVVFVAGLLWQSRLIAVAVAVGAVTLLLAMIVARRQTAAQRSYQNRLDATVTIYLNFMEQVNEGDLTARLNLEGRAGSDQGLMRLGQNLNTMMEGLQIMSAQLQQEAMSVTEAATEILNATNEQIIAATEQDSSVTQTAATVNEVRATVTETAERAQAVAETSRRTVDVTRTGEQAVTDTINGMHLIRQRVESIADTILILSEHTQQIGEIIATVNAIADQSNMLALNASVEAARAGEEGKGFAVVAMEVRNLAAQSRQAVSQIRDILSEIQQTTNTAVMVTEQGTKGVDGGMSLVDRAGEAIRELAAAIEEASHAATQIAASTRQQTVGMDQLNEAVTVIRDMTATNLSSTMRVERAARELNQVARRMDATVSQYTLDESDNGAGLGMG